MGYEVQPYSIGLDFSVDLYRLKKQITDFKPSVILFHKYFGFDTCKGIESIVKHQGLVTIEDETQFMFSDNQDSWADYYVGSIRKWGAFPDGAYLASNLRVMDQPQDEDNEFVQLETKAMSMKQAFLEKKEMNSKYQVLFVEGRQYVDAQKRTYSISSISNYRLEKLDVQRFINAHRSNARILIEGLQGYSWFECVFKEVPEGITPFMIPILVHEGRKEFQSYLAAQKIFATVIWGCPEVIKTMIGKTDRKVYDEILCIPCDHRYDGTDMMRILNAIKLYDKKRGN